jgi:hypothetical protein
MSSQLTSYNFQTGDSVIVNGWPASTVLEVTDASDRSLLTLRAPNGASLKVGRLAVTTPSETDTELEAT